MGVLVNPIRVVDVAELVDTASTRPLALGICCCCNVTLCSADVASSPKCMHACPLDGGVDSPQPVTL